MVIDQAIYFKIERNFHQVGGNADAVKTGSGVRTSPGVHPGIGVMARECIHGGGYGGPFCPSPLWLIVKSLISPVASS